MYVRYLSRISSVIVVVFYVTSYALAQTVNAPQFGSAVKLAPLAQILVPEAVFALQLLPALQQNTTTSDVQAEAVLTKLGIAPKNGWISDYPITPAVLGELDNTIATAAEQGKIPLGKSQALKQVNDLKVKLGLDVNSIANPLPVVSHPQLHTIYTYFDRNGSKMFTDDYNSIPADLRTQAKIISQASVTPGIPTITPSSTPQLSPTTPQTQSKPTVNPATLAWYYQNQGPPVITYYQPPDQYSNYYSWVPYPFWSGGYSYPGYYLLNDFQQSVYYDQKQYIVTRHSDSGIRYNANVANGRDDRNESNERMQQNDSLPVPESNKEQQQWRREEHEKLEPSFETKQLSGNQHRVEPQEHQVQAPTNSEVFQRIQEQNSQVFQRIQEQEKLQMQADHHPEQALDSQQKRNVEQHEQSVPASLSTQGIQPNQQHQPEQMQGNQGTEPFIQPQQLPNNSRNFEQQEQRRMQMSVNPGENEQLNAVQSVNEQNGGDSIKNEQPRFGRH